MRNPPELSEKALVAPSWVEKRLGISRTTRLDYEARGLLHPVRLTDTSHRRYDLAEVEALAAGESHSAGESGAPEASPTPDPDSQQAGAPDTSAAVA